MLNNSTFTQMVTQLIIIIFCKL